MPALCSRLTRPCQILHQLQSGLGDTDCGLRLCCMQTELPLEVCAHLVRGLALQHAFEHLGRQLHTHTGGSVPGVTWKDSKGPLRRQAAVGSQCDSPFSLL